MAFRFNFENPTDGNSKEWCNPHEKDTSVANHRDETAHSATEVSCANAKFDHHYKTCSLKVGDCLISYICSEDLQRNMDETEDNKRIILAAKNHSDLVTGVYEGGLKIWECTFDLIYFLDGCDVFMEGMKVLELGCGSGLVGIYAYLKGAKVDFQDYNEEVLRLLTINNVLLNTSNQDTRTMANHCRFFAGDWEAVNKFFANLNPSEHKYDVIVTSETIYNPSNQQKLLHLMKSTLKPKGKIYVAAKSYYFGVGGSTQQFEEIVRNDKAFDINVCLETAGEIPRKILLLQFRRDFDAIK